MEGKDVFVELRDYPFTLGKGFTQESKRREDFDNWATVESVVGSRTGSLGVGVGVPWDRTEDYDTIPGPKKINNPSNVTSKPVSSEFDPIRPGKLRRWGQSSTVLPFPYNLFNGPVEGVPGSVTQTSLSEKEGPGTGRQSSFVEGEAETLPSSSSVDPLNTSILHWRNNGTYDPSVKSPLNAESLLLRSFPHL